MVDVTDKSMGYKMAFLMESVMVLVMVLPLDLLLVNKKE